MGSLIALSLLLLFFVDYSYSEYQYQDRYPNPHQDYRRTSSESSKYDQYPSQSQNQFHRTNPYPNPSTQAKKPIPNAHINLDYHVKDDTEWQLPMTPDEEKVILGFIVKGLQEYVKKAEVGDNVRPYFTDLMNFIKKIEEKFEMILVLNKITYKEIETKVKELKGRSDHSFPFDRSLLEFIHKKQSDFRLVNSRINHSIEAAYFWLMNRKLKVSHSADNKYDKVVGKANKDQVDLQLKIQSEVRNIQDKHYQTSQLTFKEFNRLKRVIDTPLNPSDPKAETKAKEELDRSLVNLGYLMENDKALKMFPGLITSITNMGSAGFTVLTNAKEFFTLSKPKA